MSGVLIIGLGQIGLGYDLNLDPKVNVFTHSRAFSLHPDFQLLAAVDFDEEKCGTFSRVYGRPALTNLALVLNDHSPDVVVIAVPTAHHCAVLQTVLKLAQPRIIICEKPLSYDLLEARAMVQSCSDRGIALYVNYMRRADPGVIEVKRRIDNGDIAGPLKGVVWYSKGFLNNGSHFFNLMRYWLGPFVNSILICRGRIWDGIDPEPDMHVTYQSGEVVFLSAKEEAFSHCTAELLSQSGRLRYEMGGQLIQWQGVRPDAQFNGYRELSPESEDIPNGLDRYQWHVVEHLASAIGGQSASLCTGAEALENLEDMQHILNRI